MVERVYTDPHSWAEAISDVFEAVSRPINMEDAAKPVFERMEIGHQAYFQSSSDPLGDPWLPLADLTVALKGHAQILIETYALYLSVTQTGTQHSVRRIDQDSFIFGTTRQGAENHQHGSLDGRIPQRAFLGFSDDLIYGVEEVVSEQWFTQIVAAI